MLFHLVAENCKMAKLDNIALPIDLTAFVLTPSCCDGKSKIAPITQPNYIGLRLDESLIQHDILEQVDFHLSSPHTQNPRVTDWTNPPNPRQNRLGVYLHWTLPRFYRVGKAQTDSRVEDEKKHGTVYSDDDQPDHPTYPNVPNRYLIVRHLISSTPSGKIPNDSYQSWVIESDRLQHINDIPDDVDLEVDVSPFVEYTSDLNHPSIIQNQAEVFLGNRVKHSGWPSDPKTGKAWAGWSETKPTTPKSDWAQPGLTIMNSSNPLFAGMTFLNFNALHQLGGVIKGFW